MNRYLRYALLALLWGAVAAYILYAGSTAQRLRAARTVGKVEIEVVDSSSMGYLVSGRMVRGWIAHSGIKTKGTAVDKVPLTQIEEMIARNGFVERVDAYVTYDGMLHVDISQRRPLVRLLVDGVDSYVTAEGYVFAAPRASSLYVPVVTGSYRPPFPAGYAGSVRAHIDTESAKVDKRIAELEREKYPLYRRELQNDRNLSALRRMRVKTVVRLLTKRLESGGVFGPSSTNGSANCAATKVENAPQIPLRGAYDSGGLTVSLGSRRPSG